MAPWEIFALSIFLSLSLSLSLSQLDSDDHHHENDNDDVSHVLKRESSSISTEEAMIFAQLFFAHAPIPLNEKPNANNSEKRKK